MITIGIDPHKDTHTAVAVKDSSGEFLDEMTLPATDAGAELLLSWAHRLAGDEDLRFALEDVRNVSGRLERFLLTRAELVLRVGTRLMVGTRKSARTYGKSDSIDALAIARAALREPNLPRATHRPELRELKLLVDHREDLVSERTAVVSRLRWHLHELDPDLEPFARTLNREPVRRGLSQRLGAYGSGVQVRICRELLGRIGEITRAVLALRAEIATLIRPLAPGLLAVSGVGDLIAARLLVETGGARFATDSQLARHAGCAPIEVSSGRVRRHRLSRMGNRKLNAAPSPTRRRFAASNGIWCAWSGGRCRSPPLLPFTAHRDRREGYAAVIVVQPWIYLAQFALGLAFLGLGVWSLAAGRSGMGIFYLALAGGWMLIGFFSRRRRQV